jgi:hypothetical protein
LIKQTYSVRQECVSLCLFRHPFPFTWRYFLNAGAPLVFVTTFKLIDMFIKWIYENNERKKAPFQFQQKEMYLQEESLKESLVASIAFWHHFAMR